MKLLCQFAAVISLFPACAYDQQKEPLFTYDGKTYSKSDLPPKTQTELFQLEAEYRKAVLTKLQESVVDLYFGDIAKRQGGTAAEAREKYLASSAEPSDEEMKAFYEREKVGLPYSYETVKGEIREWIKENLAEEKKRKFLQKIEREHNVEVFLAPLVAPTMQISSDGYPSRGSKNPSVELVEYGDFTCPECAKSVKAVKELMKEFDGEVRFVFKYFPRDYSSMGESIARGAHCANKQGKFWPYHDYAFENPYSIAWEDPEDLASRLHLNAADYSSCLKEADSKDMVRRSFEEGVDFGVKGTPAFFINGKQISSGHDYDSLKKEIERAL